MSPVLFSFFHEVDSFGLSKATDGSSLKKFTLLKTKDLNLLFPPIIRAFYANRNFCCVVEREKKIQFVVSLPLNSIKENKNFSLAFASWEKVATQLKFFTVFFPKKIPNFWLNWSLVEVQNWKKNLGTVGLQQAQFTMYLQLEFLNVLLHVLAQNKRKKEDKQMQND